MMTYWISILRCWTLWARRRVVKVTVALGRKTEIRQQVRRKVVAVAARGKLLPERRGGTGGGSVRGTAGGTRSPQRRVERNEKDLKGKFHQ
jgi:hypothetical protein